MAEPLLRKTGISHGKFQAAHSVRIWRRSRQIPASGAAMVPLAGVFAVKPALALRSRFGGLISGRVPYVTGPTGRREHVRLATQALTTERLMSGGGILGIILWTLLAVVLSIAAGALAGMALGAKDLGKSLAAMMGAMYGPVAAVPAVFVGLIVLALTK